MEVINEDFKIYTEASREIEATNIGSIQTAIARMRSGGFVAITNPELRAKGKAIFEGGNETFRLSDIKDLDRLSIIQQNGTPVILSPIASISEDYCLNIADVERQDWIPIIPTVTIPEILSLLGSLRSKAFKSEKSLRTLKAAITLVEDFRRPMNE